MTARSDPLELPVHPHQIELLDFESYDLIIDLRSPGDFRDDHIPGAVNVPWRAGDPVESLAREEAATPSQPLHLGEAPVVGAYALHAEVDRLTAGAAVLLYSDRGGADGAVAAASLAALQSPDALGLRIDVLAGGWSTYRSWIESGLEVLGWCLQPRWVRSNPGGVSQAVLGVLQTQGEQVCCLSDLIGQGGFPGLLLAADPVPSQSAFNSRLVDVLRRHDPSRPVWFDEVHHLTPRLELPRLLLEKLQDGPSLLITALIEHRVALLRERLGADGVEATDGAARLRHVLAEIDPTVAGEVGELLGGGAVDDALAMLIQRGTDVRSAEQSLHATATVPPLPVALPSLAPRDVADALQAALTNLGNEHNI